MAEMDDNDFADMVEQTSVRTYVVEYREPSVDGRPGKLVGACLSDQQSDGLSMIYSFFDPSLEDRKGLGTFIILDHIQRASRAGLPYVYLGYWVQGSRSMQYKVRFRPLERLGQAGWIRLSDQEQAGLIAAAAGAQRSDTAEVDGSGKDGTPGGQDQYRVY